MKDKVQKIRKGVERIQLYTQSEVLKQVLDYIDEVQKEEIPPKFPIISSKEELKQKPFKVEKGKWYVCIKDYHDKNCTFTKGKKYKSDKDGFLVDDEDKETFERKIWEEDACEYFRPVKCMYTEYNYTDEDRKVLCDGCEEECEFNQKKSVSNIKAYQSRWGKSNGYLAEPVSEDLNIESMIESYKQRLISQANGVKNSPLVDMCLASYKHGINETLDTLNLSNIQRTIKNRKEPASEEFGEIILEGTNFNKSWYAHPELAFKAGAEWKKEQMMAKAIRGRVRVDVESNYHSLIYGCWDMNDALKNCNDGSKVKVIVIKEG